MSASSVTYSGLNLLREVAKSPTMNNSKGWVPTLIKIFSYLDNPTLKSLKSVCKNFKMLVNSQVMRIIRLKNLETELKDFETYHKEKKQSILSTEKTVGELIVALASLKTELVEKDPTLFESLTDLFNRSTGLNLFPYIKNKEKERKSLDTQYRKMKVTCSLLQMQNSLCEIDAKNLQFIIDAHKQFLIIENAKTKMTEGLLGSQYANLPILDLKGIESFYIDYVAPEWMSAPIMKGQDAAGRSFIAIRARNKETGRHCVQTFYQMTPNSSTWTDSHKSTPIISFMDYIVNMGEVNGEGYAALKSLIETKQNKYYEII